jgi:hypothetical protein
VCTQRSMHWVMGLKLGTQTNVNNLIWFDSFCFAAGGPLRRWVVGWRSILIYHGWLYLQGFVTYVEITELLHRKFNLRPPILSEICDILVTIACFLGEFTKLWKAYFSFVMSVGPSAWNIYAPTERIFVRFDIWLHIENLYRKFKFY